MSKDITKKFKINFLADEDLVFEFDQKLLNERKNGNKRFKDRTDFFVNKMKDYAKSKS